MENRILNLETKSQENNNESCEEKKGKMKNRRFRIQKYSKNMRAKNYNLIRPCLDYVCEASV